MPNSDAAEAQTYTRDDAGWLADALAQAAGPGAHVECVFKDIRVIGAGGHDWGRFTVTVARQTT